jgi:hypothetical protein
LGSQHFVGDNAGDEKVAATLGVLEKIEVTDME